MIKTITGVVNEKVGLARYLAVILVVFLAVMFVLIYSMFPSMAGIGMWLLLVLFPVGACTVVVATSYGMTESTIPVTWRLFKRPRDFSSSVQRVLKNRDSGEEILLTGVEETTFGEAFRASKRFHGSVNESVWWIEDGEGNNITDRPLHTHDDIAFLTTH
ncbi:MAG: hypothetical protein ACXADC_05295 [Candidatus Thorarchaeota archaeon]|jgi:hypothetical protein